MRLIDLIEERVLRDSPVVIMDNEGIILARGEWNTDRVLKYSESEVYSIGYEEEGIFIALRLLRVNMRIAHISENRIKRIKESIRPYYGIVLDQILRRVKEINHLDPDKPMIETRQIVSDCVIVPATGIDAEIELSMETDMPWLIRTINGNLVIPHFNRLVKCIYEN